MKTENIIWKQNLVAAKPQAKTVTLKRYDATVIGGITYWNFSLPCQSPPTVPTHYGPKLVLLPPGRWPIGAVTFVALP